MIPSLLLLLGLLLILFGASILTDGASAIARRFGLSEFLIGLVIIGIGTSAPEFVVSVFSAIRGKSDMAVGNIIGSNIFNALVITGITAIIIPVRLTRNNIQKDIPFGILASVVLFVLGSDIFLNNENLNIINRGDGIILLCFFAIFMIYTWFSNNQPKRTLRKIPLKSTVPTSSTSLTTLDEETAKKISLVNRHPYMAILFILVGLGSLLFGGNLFLENAQIIAKQLGISDSLIAITLMAGGTSIPELAACIMAALKGKGQMALGNVIGSNIFNIFMVLGISAGITPLGMQNINSLDLIVLLTSAILLFIGAFTFKKARIDRTEGVIFLLFYIGYIGYLVWNQ